jgi:hypothetical protein
VLAVVSVNQSVWRDYDNVSARLPVRMTTLAPIHFIGSYALRKIQRRDDMLILRVGARLNEYVTAPHAVFAGQRAEMFQGLFGAEISIVDTNGAISVKLPEVEVLGVWINGEFGRVVSEWFTRTYRRGVLGGEVLSKQVKLEAKKETTIAASRHEERRNSPIEYEIHEKQSPTCVAKTDGMVMRKASYP